MKENHQHPFSALLVAARKLFPFLAGLLFRSREKAGTEIITHEVKKMKLTENFSLHEFRCKDGSDVPPELMDNVKGGLWELRADIAAAMGENEKALELYGQAIEQSQLLGYPINNITLKKNNLTARRAHK